MSYAKIIVAGYVGQDPELRYTAQGQAVCNFSIAFSEKVKGEQKTEWYKVSTFGQQAENVSKYVKKGSLVLAEGKPRQQTWTDKEGNQRTSFEINFATVTFLGNKNSRDENENMDSEPSYTPRNTTNTESAYQKPSTSNDLITDDDIPF